MTDQSNRDGRGNPQHGALLSRIAQAMSALGVAPLPHHYEVFYAALSGRSPELSRDLAALGKTPSSGQIEQLGIKHNLPGASAVSLDRTRADAADGAGELISALKRNAAEKAEFAALIDQFNTRLESDPVIAMSEFADAARHLKGASMRLARDDAAFAALVEEIAERFGGIASGIETGRAAALRDPATGLPNRAAFQARLAGIFAEDGPQVPAALVLADIHGLREIGARYGAAVAEAALKTLAPTLRKTIKKDDFVARIGPDALAFIFPEVSAEIAAAITGRIRTSVEAVEVGLPGRAFTPERLSLSAGIAVTTGATGAQDLFTQADLALKAVRAGTQPATLIFSQAIGGNRRGPYSPHAA